MKQLFGFALWLGALAPLNRTAHTGNLLLWAFVSGCYKAHRIQQLGFTIRGITHTSIIKNILK